MTLDFETTIDQRVVTLNCLYGGWGQSTGTAYYKDLTLTAVAPSNSLSAYLKYAQQQPAQNLIGDAARGQDVYENNAANCMSCHPGVGPDLAGIGQRLTAIEIKEAIINPSASRAEGWEDNPAVMTEALNFLSAQDIADLVEFLVKDIRVRTD